MSYRKSEEDWIRWTMTGLMSGWMITFLIPSEYGVLGPFIIIIGGVVGVTIGYLRRKRSLAKLKSCGWCGEKIRPNEPTKFDTRYKDAIFHAACIWGMCVSKGWSYLQKGGSSVVPTDLVIDCAAGCQEYGSAGQGRLTIGKDPIWYEREGEVYRPYHPNCSPSKLD